MAVDNIEKKSASDAVSGFLREHRKLIITIGIVILAAVVVVVGGIMFFNFMEERNIAKLEDLNSQYEEIRTTINSEDAEENTSEEATKLLAEFEALGKSAQGYAGSKAYAQAASIAADQKNWAEAERLYDLSSQKGRRIYLGPLSAFNAGMMAEEAGDTEKALAHFKTAAAAADFPACAMAQFNVGRLLEATDKDAATAAYQEIRDKWPNETSWINLAESRIIALSIK
ncbi:MAG: tetratricopeptide repeat protein [Spirochaetaceae bacterium]|jgi:predicted negative regulator of RcsB-dependent stress response|nr:tetratricopeptide repeat protein [Spirochaetaceae bacterium]